MRRRSSIAGSLLFSSQDRHSGGSLISVHSNMIANTTSFGNSNNNNSCSSSSFIIIRNNNNNNVGALFESRRTIIVPKQLKAYGGTFSRSVGERNSDVVSDVMLQSLTPSRTAVSPLFARQAVKTKTVDDFKDLNLLNAELLEYLEEKQIQTPSPIQQSAMEVILQQRRLAPVPTDLFDIELQEKSMSEDALYKKLHQSGRNNYYNSKEKSVLVAAPHGEGKTLAYLLPLYQNMLKDKEIYKIPLRERRPRTILLAPTREAIKQLQHICSELDTKTGLKSISFTSKKRSKYHLSRLLKRSSADVVIMHPRVILNLIRTRRMFLDDLRYIAIDDADLMLSSQQDHAAIHLLSKIRKRNLYKHLWPVQTQIIFSTPYITRKLEYFIGKRYPDTIPCFFRQQMHRPPSTLQHRFMPIRREEEKLSILIHLLKKHGHVPKVIDSQEAEEEVLRQRYKLTGTLQQWRAAHPNLYAEQRLREENENEMDENDQVERESSLPRHQRLQPQQQRLESGNNNDNDSIASLVTSSERATADVFLPNEEEETIIDDVNPFSSDSTTTNNNNRLVSADRHRFSNSANIISSSSSSTEKNMVFQDGKSLLQHRKQQQTAQRQQAQLEKLKSQAYSDEEKSDTSYKTYETDPIARFALEHVRPVQWNYLTAVAAPFTSPLPRTVFAAGQRTVIFFPTIDAAIALYYKLRTEGFAVSLLHAALPVKVRTEMYDDFVSGRTNILCTTDIAARALDTHVDIIINFQMPTNAVQYLSRAGRTARMGRQGKVISLYTKHQGVVVSAVKAFLKKELPLEGISNRKPLMTQPRYAEWRTHKINALSRAYVSLITSKTIPAHLERTYLKHNATWRPLFRPQNTSVHAGVAPLQQQKLMNVVAAQAVEFRRGQLARRKGGRAKFGSKDMRRGVWNDVGGVSSREVAGSDPSALLGVNRIPQGPPK